MNEDTSLMTEYNSHSVASALEKVQQDISTFEQRYARTSGSVQLLAVSKRKPVSAIRDAIKAGHRAFGENYVEEAVEKILTINDTSLEWHFIGAIQSRKTASIAEHFQWVHGVDRLKVARRLSDQRAATAAALNVCLQVNADSEEAKAGVHFDEVRQLAADCADLPGIVVRGLMAIPAPRTALAEQRQVFARLRNCLDSLRPEYPSMDTLSMGMSGDLEAAIAEGATIVRVGTAIFGARDQ